MTTATTEQLIKLGELINFMDPEPTILASRKPNPNTGRYDRYKLTFEHDPDAESPRDWSNVTTLITDDGEYISPDGRGVTFGSEGIPIEWVSGYTRYNRVDVRRTIRWINLFGHTEGILAAWPLHREPREGSLSVDTSYSSVSLGRDNDEADGLCIITRDKWRECMGDTPYTTELGAEHAKGEVDTYNRWATGEFKCLSLEKLEHWRREDDPTKHTTTWDHLDSLCGIDLGEWGNPHYYSTIGDFAWDMLTNNDIDPSTLLSYNPVDHPAYDTINEED